MMEPESPGAEKGPRCLVVGQDGDLDGRVVVAVVGIDVSERLKPVDATYGGARGQAVLHYK